MSDNQSLVDKIKSADSFPEIRGDETYEELLQMIGKTVFYKAEGLAKGNWSEAWYFAELKGDVRTYEGGLKLKDTNLNRGFFLKNHTPIFSAIKNWLESSKKGIIKTMTMKVKNEGSFDLEIDWKD